ncbi:putative PAB-dependent poly(A)-specific ribonuclease subunit [Wickerhamomyces ciferrii]|uniref:PAB-dependent poly(A)-specific ribonuclease subunit n=1 Tax=Wickerhamomyces ciferrii (strain ATCC 14091 / BCRC 22168 / CBS 111 / JCM 3599 / NBRC 0793 / NRRL Y-1031 F-60-10) TaxID=1206466 RepID=K0KVF2_WICCF|nr:putative PAB-dependent poly(A)-specific ribonuclease subunit [Wickerhamomyces ciferrii]CCH45128.1 putative PAB-dependent poly(A)-specific ribonuclease subunit [Wickerhamomyces ciferrii]
MEDLLKHLIRFEHYKNNKYPIHRFANIKNRTCPTKYLNYVETELNPQNDDFPTYYAIDCEMVSMMDFSQQVGRVSMIDEDFNVVFDIYVKPNGKIRDYKYRFSGLKPIHLNNTPYDLKNCQDLILSKLKANDILIGHSIENDLKVLNLKHPLIIDTQQIYKFISKNGTLKETSLKKLTEKYLGRTIQKGPHSSVEDAIATMELAKLKIDRKTTSKESILKILSKEPYLQNTNSTTSINTSPIKHINGNANPQFNTTSQSQPQPQPKPQTQSQPKSQQQTHAQSKSQSQPKPQPHKQPNSIPPTQYGYQPNYYQYGYPYNQYYQYSTQQLANHTPQQGFYYPPPTSHHLNNTNYNTNYNYIYNSKNNGLIYDPNTNQYYSNGNNIQW